MVCTRSRCCVEEVRNEAQTARAALRRDVSDSLGSPGATIRIFRPGGAGDRLLSRRHTRGDGHGHERGH